MAGPVAGRLVCEITLTQVKPRFAAPVRDRTTSVFPIICLDLLRSRYANGGTSCRAAFDSSLWRLLRLGLRVRVPVLDASCCETDSHISASAMWALRQSPLPFPRRYARGMCSNATRTLPVSMFSMFLDYNLNVVSANLNLMVLSR